MQCIHFLYDLEDMETRLIDWHDGQYCLSIGKTYPIRIVGTLEELAQVFAMGESLVEHERMRKRMPPGFEEEKKRAQGG